MLWTYPNTYRDYVLTVALGYRLPLVYPYEQGRLASQRVLDWVEQEWELL
jgi:hypothetical protein